MTKMLDRILELREQINLIDKQSFSQQEEFGGAELVVTSDIRRYQSLRKSHPHYVVVLSENSKSLSWLISELKQAFDQQLDYMNKYVFYPEIGRAVIEYQQSIPTGESENLQNLLDAALLKAYQLLDIAKL